MNRSQVNGKPGLSSLGGVSAGRSPSKWSKLHVNLYLTEGVKSHSEKKKKKMLLRHSPSQNSYGAPIFDHYLHMNLNDLLES